MTRLWKWFGRNSAQLQGLAAVATILAALAAVPFVMSKWIQPELIIKITADSPTIPPSLEAWIGEATLMLKTLPDPPKESADPYRSLRQLQRSGPLDSIRQERSWRLLQPSRLRIDMANQSDRVIPSIRLRLDRAYPAWGVRLDATFLTAEEVTAWHKGLPAEKVGPTMVLPELPPLPPRSVITVIVYGDVADAEVSVTVPGTSFKIIPTVRVEDKGPIALILRPHWVPLALGLVVFAVMMGLAMFENVVWRRARRQVAYNLACSEAKAGRKESALALLLEAVGAGYRNYQHMRSDPDLEGLREMEAFKKLADS